MLHYIIQVIAFQGLFLLAYDVFLKRETFFNGNRFYLLGTSVLSLFLPFIKLDALKTVSPDEFMIHLPEIIIGETATLTRLDIETALYAGIAVNTPATPMWLKIILAGLCVATAIFIYKIIRLYLIKYRNPKRWKGNILFVNVLESSTAFSFLNTIFLGDAISEDKKPSIIKHELVHVEQYHTVDVLFFELMRIAFWFNPFVYMYQNRIKTLHEYIADAETVKRNDKKAYYRSLLQYVFDTPHLSCTNTFFSQSLIKKRIAMLQKSKSKKLNLLKYVFVIPIVFAMLFYSSCEKQVNSNDENTVDLEQFSYALQKDEIISSKAKKIQDSYEAFLWSNPDYVSWAEIDHETGEISYSIHHKSEEVPEGYTEAEVGSKDGSSYKMYMNFNYFELDATDTTLEKNTKAQKMASNQKTITINDDGKMEVPFSIIENAPSFSICKDLKSNDQRKKCTTNEIAKFVGKNFNTDLGTQHGLVGKQRISTWFKIDTQGNILDVGARAAHSALEDETKRVINLLPKFVPGTHHGKVVTVSYALPIVFQIADNKED